MHRQTLDLMHKQAQFALHMHILQRENRAFLIRERA